MLAALDMLACGSTALRADVISSPPRFHLCRASPRTGIEADSASRVAMETDTVPYQALEGGEGGDENAAPSPGARVSLQGDLPRDGALAACPPVGA